MHVRSFCRCRHTYGLAPRFANGLALSRLNGNPNVFVFRIDWNFCVLAILHKAVRLDVVQRFIRNLNCCRHSTIKLHSNGTHK